MLILAREALNGVRVATVSNMLKTIDEIHNPVRNQLEPFSAVPSLLDLVGFRRAPFWPARSRLYLRRCLELTESPFLSPQKRTSGNQTENTNELNS